jgi:Putative Flp pilus-assembly TadE/G-like
MSRMFRRREHGQVIILLAITILIILGMMSFALDGSYGLVREREDQNAADFATLAGTQILARQCPGPASSPISEQDVYNVVKQVLDANSGGTSTWTAEYLSANGADLGVSAGSSTGAPAGASATAVPPPACGVSVNVHSNWNSFLSQIIGTNKLATGANAAATNVSSYAQGAAIDSLNPQYPHAVLAGGSGTFIVDGNIFLNSNPGGGQTDVIDAKSSSNIYIYGNVDTVGPVNDATGDRPIDWCFTVPSGSGYSFPVGPASPTVVYSTGPPGNIPSYGPRYGDGGLPFYPTTGGVPWWTASHAASCEVNANLDKTYPVVFAYDGIQSTPSGGGDPLASILHDPFASSGAAAACPFQSLNQYGSLAAASHPNPLDPSALVLDPGKYNFPVQLGANLAGYSKIEFADCSGQYEDPSTPAGAACSQADADYPAVSLCLQSPGLFLFDQGLLVDPSSTQSVLGNNIMVATNKPLPNSLLPGNVSASGTGNGDPCLPTNVWGIPETWNGSTAIPGSGNGYNRDWDASSPCATPGLYAGLPEVGWGGCWCWGPGTHPPAPGPGSNNSLMVAGQGSVNLTPPQSDVEGYADVLLYQEPSTPANWGLNSATQAGGANIDNANITLAGVLYNPSLKGVGSTVGFNTWDNGIPFYPGGTLQTGYGAAPATLGWEPSTGNVVILGVAVVADFNTDGDTTIKVSGRNYPYKTPNGGTPPGLVG